MKNEEFMVLVNERIDYVFRLITIKREEYSPGTEEEDERLKNFYDVAAMNGENLTQALWGMVSKQIVSVKDMLRGNAAFTEGYVAEKLGDVIIYMLLAEACLKAEGRIRTGGILSRDRETSLLKLLGASDAAVKALLDSYESHASIGVGDLCDERTTSHISV